MVKKSLILFLVFIFSISLVYACVNDAECNDGEACDSEGNCVTYCVLGETQCSDGIDNDNDGSIDYYSTCEVNGVKYQCYNNYDDWISEINRKEYCYFLDATGEEQYCDDLYDANFYDRDPECRSPYDTDEMYDPECADGVDNNNDGLIDYPFDPLCESPEDSLEVILTTQKLAPEFTLWDWLKDILTFWN